MNKRIICFGNIAFDLITKSENASGKLTFHAHPVGSVNNTAVILTRLGLPVSLISKTGKDFLGTSLIKTLKSTGIDTQPCPPVRGPDGFAVAALLRIESPHEVGVT